MTRCLGVFLSVLAGCFAVFQIAQATGVTVIRLKSEISTTDDVVLADVVEDFSQIPVITPYASLVIAPKPPLHGIRTVSGRQIEAMLRQRGLTGIKVEGQYVRITAAKQNISSEQIAEFLTDEIAIRLGKDRSDVLVSVSGTDRYVPSGDIVLSAELPSSIQKGGSLVAKVTATVGDTTTVWSVPINVKFRKEVVVVASEPVRRDQPLEVSNLEVIVSWVKDEASYPSLEDLEGRVAATYLQVGRVIKKSDVMIPPLVMPGQNVTIRYIGPEFVIEAPGVVLEKGYFGDWVRVNNQHTQKTVTARVTSPTLVTVLEGE